MHYEALPTEFVLPQGTRGRSSVESITVTTSGLTLVLKLTGVASVPAELGVDMTNPEVRDKFQGTDGTMRVEIPMRFKHRSGRKEILLPDSTTAEPADATQETLVIAVAP